MTPDILTLHEWYATQLGKMAAEFVARQVEPLVAKNSDACILGLGYSRPYLQAGYRKNSIAAMPAQMGVMRWPQRGENRSTLVWPDQMPFDDNTFDTVIAVHLLEFASDADAALAECYRILRPEGNLVVVVPNRMGLWSRREVSPFAHGRPFSRAQICSSLEEADFRVEKVRGALFMPPFVGKWMRSLNPKIEKFCSDINLPMGGVVVVNGVKHTVSGTVVRVGQPMLRRRDVSVPVGAGMDSM